jgi:hypothetical protein
MYTNNNYHLMGGMHQAYERENLNDELTPNLLLRVPIRHSHGYTCILHTYPSALKGGKDGEHEE